VTPWLPTLEKAIHALAGRAARGFRLFLTAEAHPRFPPTLLEACAKVKAPPYRSAFSVFTSASFLASSICTATRVVIIC
jgi:hypothetical protein